jgi:hypothetical protein
MTMIEPHMASRIIFPASLRVVVGGQDRIEGEMTCSTVLLSTSFIRLKARGQKTVKADGHYIEIQNTHDNKNCFA